MCDRSWIDAISELRAFNRLYTRRIGVLGEGLLDTSHPLPDARVLYELGQADDLETSVLRDQLGMDAGFLSRVLTRLERQDLVVRGPSPDDARRQRARLTPAGRGQFAALDLASQRFNGVLAETLGPAGLEALRTVRAALEPRTTVALRAPEPGDLGWIVARHGALYADQYGWDERFEALVARVVADFDPATGRIWIATSGGARVGCVMSVPEEGRTARLRLLLVEPHARGLGAGGTLVDACLDHARATGAQRVVLWTNDVLTGARRLYDRRGFRLVDETPHTMFGPPVVGQTLTLPLATGR